MTLLKDFYSLNQFAHGDGTVSAKIVFNKDHPIFRGHFPGTPIVPGVCMMQIVTEIMETALTYPVRVSTADTIKFLSVIDPERQQEIEVVVTYNQMDEGIRIQASLFNGSGTFFKLKAVLTTL
jgi:3-hydroxyacyl-[acyl-carrier-protein] dehydratase